MKLVFATHNHNKLKEIQTLLPAEIQLMSLDQIGCTAEIPENENTLEGNAMAKARHVKEHYGYDCFADDTGLLVDVLDGAPGVYSARYAGPEKDAQANMAKLLQALQGQKIRDAHFKTAIALIIGDSEHLFTGIAKGKITTSPQGEQGFGYDPIFMPEGYTDTFAQMPLSTKNAIGHRGKATQKLIQYLTTKAVH